MNNREQRYRVLMANIGLDGHEVGSIVVTQALRDAGMEVIYLGLCQTPETIAVCAIHEGVDLIGISSMCGAHVGGIPATIRLLEEKGASNIQIIAGGIIPDEDVKILKEAGVKEVFGPGTPTSTIVDFVKNNIRIRE